MTRFNVGYIVVDVVFGSAQVEHGECDLGVYHPGILYPTFQWIIDSSFTVYSRTLAQLD